MANGLKVAKKPKLHQALHGYADGHHQLALSTTLKPRDQKILLELSDISGPGGNIGLEGYLTGYPLSESGLFALGRTWPALEMPRPGCVWTHTLLIDFTDLAELETLTGLLDLFRRPTGANAASEYAEPAIFAPDTRASVPTLAEGWTRQVIAALYGRPRRRIVAGHFGGEVDTTVLALWSQQWPRLRRSFRFCTFATSDRSANSSSFDLQIVPHSDRSVRTRFADAVYAETSAPSFDQWLDDAVQDLLHPNRFGLRSSFRRLGADIVVGREAFRPLCRLHRSLTAIALMLCIAVLPARANYFDCSVVYDEFDQLMLANFLVDPERYVDTLVNQITRKEHVDYQIGEFKLRDGRDMSGIGVFVTNQNIRGKMLYVWQDNAWELRTPLVIDEMIIFGRVRDGYAPVRNRSVYVTPNLAIDLDTASVVDADDETADLVYEFERGIYSLRAIEPAQIFFPIESMCHKL